MTRGLMKAERLKAVEQAAMVWVLLDEDTHGEHLAEFVEGGSLAVAPEALPYNPEIMAGIAKIWNG